MKKQLIWLVSLALLGTAGAAAIAQEHGAEHEHKRNSHERGLQHDPGRMAEHLSRRLDLDESQRQEVENVLSATHPEMRALYARASENRERLSDLDPEAQDYGARLDELAAEKGAIETEKTLLHGRLKAELNAVLTPEQRQQLSNEGRSMHKGRMHKRFREREGRSPRSED